MLEVVPSMGYYETLDIHEVADLWVDDEINQKQNNLSESSAVPASSKAKTIPDNQATSSGYITELRKKDTALAKKIDDMKFQGYTLDAVPDVPKGAKLVTIENLIKNTKGASSKQVEYVNWFSTDDSLYPVTETIIKEKHLKAEPHPKGCLTFGVRFSIG